MEVASTAAALTDGVVTLRGWREDDVPAIVAACSDPETALWLDALPQPYREADARAWLAAELDAARFAIDQDGSLAGSISVRFDVWEAGAADVGYWVGPWARGRGVATRALRLVAGWALGTACGADLSRAGSARAASAPVTSTSGDSEPTRAAEPRVERLQLRADVDNVASCTVAERVGFRREGTIRAARWNARRGRRVDLALYSLLPGEL